MRTTVNSKTWTTGEITTTPLPPGLTVEEAQAEAVRRGHTAFDINDSDVWRHVEGIWTLTGYVDAHGILQGDRRL